MKSEIFFAILLAVLPAVVFAEDKQPSLLKFSELSHPEDTATVETTNGATRLRIKTSQRAGHCVIVAEKGTWPERVTLALDGLKALEHFELSAGRMYVNGSTNTSEKFSLFFLGDDRNFNQRSLIGTAKILVERHKEGMLVVFPDRFFADADKVTVGWVSWLDR